LFYLEIGATLGGDGRTPGVVPENLELEAE
jgi:hypothetical protein